MRHQTLRCTPSTELMSRDWHRTCAQTAFRFCLTICNGNCTLCFRVKTKLKILAGMLETFHFVITIRLTYIQARIYIKIGAEFLNMSQTFYIALLMCLFEHFEALFEDFTMMLYVDCEFFESKIQSSKTEGKIFY